MSDLKFFTLRGRIRSVVADEADADEDPEVKGIMSGLRITPTAKGHTFIKATTLTPDPALMVLCPIRARIDNGVLSLRETQADVRLVAKSDVLDLGDTPLVYRLDFFETTFNGSTQSLPSLTIEAPIVAEGHDDGTDGEVVVDIATADWLSGS